MLKSSIVNLTNYNLWANTKIFNFILDAGEERVDVVQNSSFPTIRKTLYHIWDAETIWISRLNGISLTSFPSKNFLGNLKESMDPFLKISHSFIDYTEVKNEADFDSDIAYKNLEGKEFSNGVSQIIMHCMNHSTFHRGQIITMLRNVGCANFTSTDYISYCRL